jgi:hypothetical protein
MAPQAIETLETRKEMVGSYRAFQLEIGHFRRRYGPICRKSPRNLREIDETRSNRESPGLTRRSMR